MEIAVSLSETQAKLLMLAAETYMHANKESFQKIFIDEGLALDDAVSTIKSALEAGPCSHVITYYY